MLEAVPFAGRVKINELQPENDKQMFYLVDNMHSRYIISVHDGTCLKSNGKKQLAMGEWTKSACEQWELTKADEKGVFFRNQQSKKYLDVPGYCIDNGTVMIEWSDLNKGANQVFILEEC